MQTQFRFHTRDASLPLPPRIDPDKYTHSPAHHAVACKDYARLRRIISVLPKPAMAGRIQTESDAIAEEIKAEALSAVIDRRDVPLRETPLHLAVRLGDVKVTEILMSAGADCSLQNEHGWSALQEAICARQDAIAKVIIKHYQSLAWAKWCRRVPRIIAAMQRMRDFYMEVSFNFESSVIPLIARVAPSDTYRMWKRGSNLRADMTLSGFDGFKIQRSGQTFLFLGEGNGDGKLPGGSLCVLDHKSKEITNALEGADKELTASEVAKEVAEMTQTNLYRPGIDVTQAVLVPQLSWMWQEKVETVHGWKAKVYDMHNVMLSIKSRSVPGAMIDEELFLTLPNLDGEEHTQEKTKRMGKASTSRNLREDEDTKHRTIMNVKDDAPRSTSSAASPSVPNPDDRKGWFGRSRKGAKQQPLKKTVSPRSSGSSDKKVRLTDVQLPGDRDAEETAGFLNDISKTGNKSKDKITVDGNKVNELKKGFRPILWLTPDFPLKTEELLPLLDILADKVKAVRRIRELLTTKLPEGTFPVKIAFPVIPTIRVVITFSKFEELKPKEEFVTPPSSPDTRNHQDQHHESSWLSWITGITGGNVHEHLEEENNLFAIPDGYTWTRGGAKKGTKG